MLEPEFYLTRATPEDAAFAAAVIVKTAEGMLEYALAPAAAMLGISSTEELISLALLQGDSALRLDNIQLLKVRYLQPGSAESSDPADRAGSAAGVAAAGSAAGAGQGEAAAAEGNFQATEAEAASAAAAAVAEVNADGEFVEEIVGLCLAYPLEHNAGLLPDIALDMLPAEAVDLFRQVLPSQLPEGDLPAGGEGMAQPGVRQDGTVPAQPTFQDRFSAARRAVCDHAMYLNTLWVSSEWRGLHLGSLLISELKEQARDFGCGEIVLHCFNDNIKAEAFYQAQGFARFASCSYPAEFARCHQGGSLWRCSTAGDGD